MALTEKIVANMMLSRIGDDLLTTATGDFTEKADFDMESIFDYTRDELLQYFPWKFSIARSKRSQAALVTSNLWAFTYSLPTDCLRVLSVESDTSAETAEPPWDIEESNIVTNEESSADEVWIRFIKQITDVTKMTMDFVNCWVLLGASRLAIPISNDKDLAKELTIEFLHEVLNAFNTNRAMGHPLNKSRVERVMEISFIELIKGRMAAQEG